MTGQSGPDSGPERFPPQVLRDYALLADGERGAVLGPRGDIVWMCAPRWDSDAVFAALLGGPGGYSITPVDRCVWGGYYEEGSMIWRSRWITNYGVIECREALAFPGDPHRAVLLRRVTAVDGDSKVRITLSPRAGFGRHGLTQLHHVNGSWTGRSGELYLRWTGAPTSTRPIDRHDGLIAGLLVPAGGHHDLILEISDQVLPAEPPDPDRAWDATDTAWAATVPDLDNCLEPRDARRSHAVLRGLTSASGGMVAAATTSLPERAEAGRPELRLPVRLDPRPVLRRPSRRRGRCSYPARRRGPVRDRPDPGPRARPETRLHHAGCGGAGPTDP